MDEYLTHLFCDIFSRDLLSWQNREIATVIILLVLEGVRSPLQSHIKIATVQGVIREQINEIDQVLSLEVDSEIEKRFREALT
nr:carboxymuconolactone decarboxylase family protein [Acinetobacter boissieri]